MADPKCWLTDLPVEVLVRITYYISTSDLANVRLTCRGLEQALFNFFSHEFFRKKQFMLSTFSLQALNDISIHTTLSPFLKHVILATDHLPGYLPQGSEDQVAACRAHYADLTYLLETGVFRDLLADAFGKLRNLETIDIRDFNSKTRKRDGAQAVWRSYGARTLEEATGQRVEAAGTSTWLNNVSERVHPSSIFRVMVAALAVARACPKSIEVNLRTAGWFIQDSAFFIHPRLESFVIEILQGLSTLHLTVDTTNTTYLRKFLSKTTHLSWLRINSSVNAAASTEQPFLEWLSRSPSTTQLPPLSPATADPAHFQNLQRLDLGSFTVAPALLLNLVAKFAGSLRSFSLRRVSLVDDKADAEDKVNPWTGFFSSIARLPGVNIRQFELSLLTQRTNGHEPSNVFFTSDASVPVGVRPSLVPVTYTGDSTQTIVKKILVEMKTTFNAVLRHDGFDDDSMDEDSEMDDSVMDGPDEEDEMDDDE